MMSRINKSCDQCRQRKVRCIAPDAPRSAPIVCNHCAKRGETCHFSLHKRRFLPKVSSPRVGSTSGPDPDIHDLYIDCILRDELPTEELTDETGIIKTSDTRVPSSSLVFFSDPQVEQLSQKIGSNRIKNLIQRVDTLIAARLRGRDPSSWPRIQFTKPHQQLTMSKQTVEGYIDGYFKYVHPRYPFLDRDDFITRVSASDVSSDAPANPALSALYHAVLALGSQYVDGGTFRPGHGVTWTLFQTALGYLADVLVPKESLDNLQALAAMAIFAMNACCLQLDDTLIAEAARMALSLRYHKSANASVSQLRTFWVIYYMEKHSSFQNRMSSIFSDDDIACPIPPTSCAIFENYDWFLSMIRFARLSSMAYTTLFTVSARKQSHASCLKAIDRIYQRLEDWRLSIPDRFRPGEPISHLNQLTGPGTKLVTVQTHYFYFSLRIVLERLVMQVASERDSRRENSKVNLMWCARTVTELTRYIDIEPHIPMFVLGVMPLSGLFILFDFVMHNPLHEETRDNMALLDAGTGYFSYLDYASRGALPGSLYSEFTQIARDFCNQEARDAKKPVEPSQRVGTDASNIEDTQRHEQHENTQVYFQPDILSMQPNEYLQDTLPSPTDMTMVYPMTESFNLPEGNPVLDYGDLKTFFGALVSDWNDIS